MPATRSSSQQPRSQPFPTASPPRPHKTASVEIISFSSSEGESSRGTQTKKRQEKPKAQTRPKRVVVPADIIEISSDDDSDVPLAKRKPIDHPALVNVDTEPSAIADFRRQINKYREETAKYKRDYERASKELGALREENKELEALRKPAQGKITLDASKLTDHLDCEICTGRMWTPYVLPDCGHTFCQSCLHDWFDANQKQYIAAHPTYNPNQAISNNDVLGIHGIAQHIMFNPQAAANPQITAMLEGLLPKRPQFTCPTCREEVRSRPTEAFALKALVRTVSAAMGESSPKKASTGRGKAPAAAAPGPWDGFFPRKRA